MFKKIIFSAVLALILTGCGHTVSSYSKGLGVDVSWNPDSFVPSVRAGFYEFLFTANKENAHVRYNSNMGLDLGFFSGFKSFISLFKDTEDKAVNTGTGTVFEVKTGPMTTGYVREVLLNPDVKPEHVEIAKQIYQVSFEGLDSKKEIQVTRDGVNSNVTPKVVTKKTLTTTEVTTPANEYTQEAIKKQVNPDSWIDAIRKIIVWGIFVIVVGLLLYVLIKKRFKN